MTTMSNDILGRPIQSIWPGTVQVVAFTAASAPCANPFGANTTVLRIVATQNCHYVLDTSPTATTSHSYLPAGVVEYISVRPGYKIAFIRNSADGNAYCTEGA